MSKINDSKFFISNRGNIESGWTGGRSFGNAGSADDILKLGVSGTSQSITLTQLSGQSGLNDRLLRAYPERGMTRTSPHRRSAAGTRSRARRANQEVEASSATVPALMVVPIPSPAGELIAPIAAYRHQLGEAGGQCLIWRLIGNPKVQDSIFKEQIAGEPRSRGARITAAFLKAVDDAASETDFVEGEYYKLTRNLGIPPGDLPAILFVAPDPVNALAVLYLDVAMFRDDSLRQALALKLVESITQNKILGLMPDGQFSRQSMCGLQEYLDELAVELHNLTIHDSMPGARCGEAARDAASVIVHGSDCRGRKLSIDQYRRMRTQWGRYDVVIDGLEGKCIKPHESKPRDREIHLESAEYWILRDYIVNNCFVLPHKAGGSHANAASALRTLQKARQKLEYSGGKKGVRWFADDRSWSRSSRFRFVPPQGKRWLLIDPVMPEDTTDQ